MRSGTDIALISEREREQTGAMQPGITVAIGGASWHGIAEAFKHDLHTEHDG